MLDFYTEPDQETLTEKGLNARMALINELIQSTSDATALQTLQRVNAALLERMGRGTESSVLSP